MYPIVTVRNILPGHTTERLSDLVLNFLEVLTETNINKLYSSREHTYIILTPLNPTFI